jgi:hypothetical protein
MAHYAVQGFDRLLALNESGALKKLLASAAEPALSQCQCCHGEGFVNCRWCRGTCVCGVRV